MTKNYQTFDLNNFPNTVWEKHENTNTSKQLKNKSIRTSVIQHTNNLKIMKTLHKKNHQQKFQENNIKNTNQLNTCAKDCFIKKIEYAHKKLQYKSKDNKYKQ